MVFVEVEGSLEDLMFLPKLASEPDYAGSLSENLLEKGSMLLLDEGRSAPDYFKSRLKQVSESDQ